MQKLKAMSWKCLIKAAQKQSMKTEENRTDNMFFRGVQELLASKMIYLKSYADYQREPDIPLTKLVGYYDTGKKLENFPVLKEYPKSFPVFLQYQKKIEKSSRIILTPEKNSGII